MNLWGVLVCQAQSAYTKCSCYRGLGIPPGNLIFKIRCNEIKSGSNFDCNATFYNMF